ncbi:snapalysin family zinc-dependent metalloprotease [Streptomyces sp. URMC 123]|uniref:snapalysin family zinc-dependent metalloprotease n=1 Tax=Streptomyces sp. URMC 123 TaxID=3423403 RepID=UPI003F1A0E58
MFGNVVRAVVVVGLSACGLVSGPALAAAAPPPAEDRAVAARVLTYNAQGAAEFAGAVRQGVTIWNDSVANVELVPAPAGQRANIRIVADNGWPRAVTTSLGNGTVYMGRQAVNQGYDTVRIAAHELGHILGLPDRKPGPCSSLMSGSSAGVSCTNPYPDAAEKQAVERNFSGSSVPARPQRTLVFQD